MLLLWEFARVSGRHYTERMEAHNGFADHVDGLEVDMIAKKPVALAY